jgi:hypothetical protein
VLTAQLELFTISYPFKNLWKALGLPEVLFLSNKFAARRMKTPGGFIFWRK